MDIGPGAKQQPLHRDDYLYFHTHQDITQSGYKVGADMMMLMFVPGVETTIENGATLVQLNHFALPVLRHRQYVLLFATIFTKLMSQVVPGSHLWDDVRTPVDSEVCYATMNPGEVLLVLGSTWHAGGANKTKDVRRPQNTFFFTRGMYRPEVCVISVNFISPTGHTYQRCRKIRTLHTYRNKYWAGLRAHKLLQVSIEIA